MPIELFKKPFALKGNWMRNHTSDFFELSPSSKGLKGSGGYWCGMKWLLVWYEGNLCFCFSTSNLLQASEFTWWWHHISIGDGKRREDKLMKKPCFWKAGQIYCANCYCCRCANGQFPAAESREPSCPPCQRGEEEKLPGFTWQEQWSNGSLKEELGSLLQP